MKRQVGQKASTQRSAAPPSALKKTTLPWFLVAYIGLLCILAMTITFVRDWTLLYAFFWRGGWMRFSAWGLMALALAPGGLIAGVSGVLLWTMIGFLLWRSSHLRGWLDRRARATAWSLLSACLACVLLLGMYGQSRYAQLTRQVATLKDMLTKLDPSIVSRPLKPPYDFAFVDAPALKAMYAQLEPSLREKERTVQVAGTVAAEGKLSAGSATVGASSTERREETSQMQAVPTSLERSASDLITDLSKNGQLPVYRDNSVWMVERLFAPVRSIVEKLDRALQTGDFDTLDDGGPQLEEIKKQYADLPKAMNDDLATIHGQIVVEGKWRVIRGSDSLRLEHAFFDPEYKGDQVIFACDLPANTFEKRRELIDVRVFGTVKSVNGKRIDLRPLAVFY